MSQRISIIPPQPGKLFLPRWLEGLALVMAFCLVVHAESVTAPSAKPPLPFEGLLQFLDGSSLHGSLSQIDPSRGIRWQHPDAKAPIVFRPNNISGVSFDRAYSTGSTTPYKCRFRFKNGDELFGNLVALNGQTVEMASWLGDHLRTPRSAVDSITFLSKGYSVLYEGPSDLEGWVQGQGQKPWEYRDGALVANGVGLLGRNMKLKGSCSVEVDLAWRGNFSLVLILYTDTLNRFDYGVNTYMFYLGPGYMSAQKIQANSGITQLGPQLRLPGTLKKTKMRLELRANRDDATFTVLVDGVPVQTWRDSAGFNASGEGIVFFSQMDGPSISLSNIRVSEWDGRTDVELTDKERGMDDLLRLANRDRVRGNVLQLKEGKLAVNAAETNFEIPVERVTQVYLGGTNQLNQVESPWLVRTYLAGGGNISFQLDKWDDQQVSGVSPLFGPLTFSSRSVRQIYLNLKQQAEAARENESEDEESQE